jgi:hypothetical protein
MTRAGLDTVRGNAAGQVAAGGVEVIVSLQEVSQARKSCQICSAEGSRPLLVERQQGEQ